VIVMDTSAVLAYLNAEAGAEVVEPAFADSSICSVNYSEVVRKLNARGFNTDEIVRLLARTEMVVEPFTARDAEIAASLHHDASLFGLSLADRACLALALRLGVPVMTADQAWAKLSIDTEIQVIRLVNYDQPGSKNHALMDLGGCAMSGSAAAGASCAVGVDTPPRST
jgi:ribonuclease VapC